MRHWKLVLLVTMVLGLIGMLGCAKGVSQAEYDKAKADLATAQGQAKELETQLGSVKASLDKANADLAQAKADLATAQARVQKTEGDLVQTRMQLDKVQGTLNAVQPYAKFLDLLLENQRQQIGLKPKYWQYSQEYVQAEVLKSLEATKDPTLKTLADRAFAEQGGGQAGWMMWLYATAATTGILTGEGVPSAAIPSPPVFTASPTGETVIRVKLLQMDGKPIPNVEVDLWSEDAPPGPPNAGIKQTDASGVASFTVGPGNYRVDFNRSNFPPAFIVPSGGPVQAQKGMIAEVEIRAFNK